MSDPPWACLCKKDLGWDRGMESKKAVQHVYLVGAKSMGAYGGYETFVYKLTEYHQNKDNIKYHVACKANGDGCIFGSDGKAVAGSTVPLYG